MTKRNAVGGQAVIEGVMMRGAKGIATAVRTPSGDIEVDMKETVPYTRKHRVLGLPVIRGFISLVESLVVGIQTLNYSASFFEEELEPSRFESWFNNVFKEKSKDVIMGLSLMLSLGFAVLLFFIVPTIGASVFRRLGIRNLGLNIIEGCIRVTVFLLYIYLIAKMEDIKRVFQYHGAEHKTIFCYENNVELTPDNVSKFQRFHPRCGTNFLFLVMMVSIVLFSLTGWNSIWQRILYRIILLPIVSGITYELIKWLGKSKSRIASVVAGPGLRLQGLTTREPDYSQLEVAIVALKAAEGMEYEHLLRKQSGIAQEGRVEAGEDGENSHCSEEQKPSDDVKKEEAGKSIGQLLSAGYELLKDAEIESYMLDAQLLLSKALKKDKIFIITNRELSVSCEEAEEYMQLIEARKTKKPIKYLLGETEFMGINLIVKEGVLIPRPDTEILVEEVIREIGERGYSKVCDVCSGSGAIGLAIAEAVSQVKIEFYDISPIAREVNEANIHKLGLQDKTSFYSSDLLDEAVSNGKVFDVIVSNPPYIRSDVIPDLMEDVKAHEPYLALCGGEDGLDFYRKITVQSLKCLKQGGLLAFEIGFDQGEEVQEILKANGFQDITCVKDLAGNNRVVRGIRK
jgi:release factor-specific protein-(glutamine-N5) methyltransferase